jgi:PhnB protein
MATKTPRGSRRKASDRKKSGGMRMRSGRVRRAARKTPKRVRPVPAGYHTITPHIVVHDCAGAIEFYKTAFGAKERGRMAGPDGKIVHAEVQVGDSIVMMNDEMPPMQPGMPGVYKSPRTAGLVTGALFLYVKDADAAFERAVQAGCIVRQHPTDMFWGDRYGVVIDPFGHTWSFGTRIEDVTRAEMEKRQRELYAGMRPGNGAKPS